MNINQKLLVKIKSYLDDYECELSEVKKLLCGRNQFEIRQQNAVALVESIMSPHGKRHLFKHVYQLGQVEYTIRPILRRQRDHVVHALLSFILGIYINEYFINSGAINRVDCFQWELAGLLHDIGYPIEIANQAILSPFFKDANKTKSDLGFKNSLGLRIVPVGLDHLTNHKKSLDLIQQQLNSWDLTINARTEYKRSINSNNINHGIIGSLILLNLIDAMYQRYNRKRVYNDVTDNGIDWNQYYFEKDIIPACTAIFLHNLPKTCFTQSKIEISKAPLAFLLKLADTLQEWERPSKDHPHGFPSSAFDIKIENHKLFLFAEIPEENKSKIRDEIAQSLADPNVEIV